MDAAEIRLTAKVGFELIARRAGGKLGKLDDALRGVWLNAVKDHHAGDISGSDRQAPDGTNIERVSGTIMRLYASFQQNCAMNRKPGPLKKSTPCASVR